VLRQPLAQHEDDRDEPHQAAHEQDEVAERRVVVAHDDLRGGDEGRRHAGERPRTADDAVDAHQAHQPDDGHGDDPPHVVRVEQHEEVGSRGSREPVEPVPADGDLLAQGIPPSL